VAAYSRFSTTVSIPVALLLRTSKTTTGSLAILSPNALGVQVTKPTG
jgi:hypothetical protein